MPPAFSESRNTGASPAWKPSTISWRCLAGRPPCRNRLPMPRAVQVGLEQAAHLDVLGEHQDRVALRGDHVDQLVEGVELARSARRRGPRWRRYCAGWLQICFRAGEQLEHQAPALRCPRRRAIRARVSLHDRLVEGGLLGGEGHDPIGLGLRRQVGRDVGVALAAAEQEGAHEAHEPLGGLGVPVPLDGHGDVAAERLERAEQAGRRPVEDRPQLAEAVLDRRAGEGDRGSGPGCARNALAVRASGFLTCWASSATTSAPCHLGQRRGIAPSDAVGGEHHLVGAEVVELAAAAVVATDGDGSARSARSPAAQLPSSEAGQTTSIGPCWPLVSASWRWRAMTWTVLPRPMSSARHPPRPSVGHAPPARPALAAGRAGGSASRPAGSGSSRVVSRPGGDRRGWRGGRRGGPRRPRRRPSALP